MIFGIEGDTPAQLEDAKTIQETLQFAYPGHPWCVRVYPGGFFIKHLGFPSNWGMNYRDGGRETYSASAFKRRVILMAGEWLERANVRRGRCDADEDIVHVEGIPDKYQPHVKPPTNYAVTVAPADIRGARRG